MSAVAAPAAVRTPRGRTGLAAVLVAAGASVLAYALQAMGLSDEVPGNLVVYGIVFTGFAVAGWYAIRRFARGADPVLYPTAVLLGGLGLAMLYRLMVDRGHPEFAAEQAVWLAIGLASFVLTIVVIRDVRQLDAYTYTIGLAGLILLLLPIVPGVGTEVNGAKLWVNLGFVTFQPAEAGRILIVIFLASYLSQRREMLAAGVGRLGLPRPKDLGPLLLAWGASLAVLFLERDMGASLLLFGVFVVMMWVATGRWSYLILGLVLFAIGAYVGYLAFSHVQVRVDAWLHAMDPQGGRRPGLSARAGMVRAGHRRDGRHRARAGLAHPDPLRRQRLHPRGVRRGARHARRRGAPPAVPGAGRAWAADRGRAHRRVREAARGRAHDAARPPGLRDRRAACCV